MFSGCSCMNYDGNCEGWAARGECTKNPDYMLNKCQKACGVCVVEGKCNTS